MTANSIFFKFRLKGNGIVNFDSKEQKEAIKKCGISLPDVKNSNYNFGKKSFYKDMDGNMTFVPKISAECLRNKIFNVVSNPAIIQLDAEMCDFLSHMSVLMRGWLFTYRNNFAIRRSSAVRITSAKEVSGAVPVLEIHSTSENKELSETTMFYAESMGDTEYECKGVIDIKTLEFLTCDVISDCRGFKEDWVQGENALLNLMFKNRYGKIPYKLGYFTSIDSTLSDFFAEYGIKFDKDFVKQMIKEFLKWVLKLRIERAKGYVETTSLEIKFNENALRDLLNDDEGWITVNGDNLDSLDFDIKDYFKEVDDKDREENRKKLIGICEGIKADIKTKKDEKKTSKANKKSGKSNNKEEE